MNRKHVEKKLRIMGYGAAGSMVGSTVGYFTGSKTGLKVARRAGAVGGIVVGDRIEARREKRKGVSEQEQTKGKEYQSRVGTKTQGRVSKKDHPYMKGGK